MTIFKYRALSESGAELDGVMEAYDEFEAVAKIKQNCPVVLSIKEVPKRESKDLFSPRKVKDKSLSLVCSQFSIILSAGLPMIRSVQLVADQTTDKHLKKILKDVAEDVDAGRSLAESFESRGPALPTTFIETIRAGEESGTLERSFAKLHDYYDKAAKTHSKVTSALIYPAFLSAVAVVVIMILMIFAVPVFTATFEEMDIEMPLPTRIVIGMSNFMNHYWIFLLLAIALTAFGLKVYSATERGRRQFAFLKLHLPMIGNVQKMNAAAQFANTMSTMLTAGLPITRTLSITGKVLDNYLIGLKISDMVGGIEQGKRLAVCMQDCPELPGLLVEMTGVGEETGSLEGTLGVIGEFYDNEVQLSVSRLLALLEPSIIVVMALIIGLIVMAVYLPMFSMYGSVSAL